jgi:sterol desaturase/sphingolipid hydroxylase (fatty acid hydroxylase superfamily)
MVLGPLVAHLGYDLGPWLQPLHHYHHHHRKVVNFGGWPLGFWDKVFGTEHRPRRPAVAAVVAAAAAAAAAPSDS